MRPLKLACIIDDDGIFVFATRRLMEIASFCEEVIVYRNGKDALDGLSERMKQGFPLPEVILLDLNMPVLDGFQFLEQFSSWPFTSGTSLYMITSSINPEDMQKAATFPIVKRYITKPISLDALHQIRASLG